jgi:hypothetical protein
LALKFRLAAGSQAVDNGKDLSAVFNYDIEGNPREPGKWDIGAFEYGMPVHIHYPASSAQRPNPRSALPNPWIPQPGYKIINMAGNPMSGKDVPAGVYLVRKTDGQEWARVTV